MLPVNLGHDRRPTLSTNTVALKRQAIASVSKEKMRSGARRPDSYASIACPERGGRGRRGRRRVPASIYIYIYIYIYMHASLSLYIYIYIYGFDTVCLQIIFLFVRETPQSGQYTIK